jgi:hypothetical protein
MLARGLAAGVDLDGDTIAFGLIFAGDAGVQAGEFGGLAVRRGWWYVRFWDFGTISPCYTGLGAGGRLALLISPQAPIPIPGDKGTHHV